MIFLFFLELFILFFLSRITTKELSQLFYRIFKSQRITIFLISFIFLPGTIIHELSHAIMAKLLFVNVGKMELMPNLERETLKLGSVEVGKSDIFRDFFIGIAPFITGMTILISLLYFSFSNNIYGLNLLTFALIYVIFMITNTMYSSRKDLEGAVEFFTVILIFIIAFYFVGVKIDIKSLSNLVSVTFIEHAVFLMIIPIIINTSIIVFAKILNRN